MVCRTIADNMVVIRISHSLQDRHKVCTIGFRNQGIRSVMGMNSVFFTC